MGSDSSKSHILDLLAHNSQLPFSQIQLLCGIQSNALAYHLKMLQRLGVVVKENGNYKLTSDGESLAVSPGKLTPIPVVLLMITRNSRVALVKRVKVAYRNYWAMPGGRIRFGEDPEETARRTAMRELGVSLKSVSFRGLFSEKVVSGDSLKHHFMFYLYAAEAGEDLAEPAEVADWFLPDELVELVVVPSDLKMMECALSDRKSSGNIVLSSEDGELELVSFEKEKL